MKERQDATAFENDSYTEIDDNEDELDAEVIPAENIWTPVVVEDEVQQPTAITGKAIRPVERDAEEYNMNHQFRGKAVIFNQKKFTIQGLPTRRGTNKDRDDIARTLSKLEFTIESYNNLSCDGVLQKISDLSKEDHNDRDCLVVVVLSHGEANRIYAADDFYLPNELWDPFTAEKCPTLAGKPKIFLIQACKGKQLDGGTVMHPNVRSFHETDGPFNDTYKIPNRADFLIVFSTFPGYASWRDIDLGSCFIQSVCKILDEDGHQRELISMMTSVSRHVALEFESDLQTHKRKQIPFVTHTLIRDVYFRPKAIPSTDQTLTREPEDGSNGSILQPSVTPDPDSTTVDGRERPHRNPFTDCKACCCVA